MQLKVSIWKSDLGKAVLCLLPLTYSQKVLGLIPVALNFHLGWQRWPWEQCSGNWACKINANVSKLLIRTSLIISVLNTLVFLFFTNIQFFLKHELTWYNVHLVGRALWIHEIMSYNFKLRAVTLAFSPVNATCQLSRIFFRKCVLELKWQMAPSLAFLILFTLVEENISVWIQSVAGLFKLK